MTTASESRARRRIRRAVESRGHTVTSMEYKPWYNGGEKSGICGGWSIQFSPGLVRSFIRINVFGLSVDEVLAAIDYWLPPAGPCDCDRKHDPMTACRIKGDPKKPTHGAECPHHIRYTLPWWKKNTAGVA
jgi:hypothetical protein